MTNEDELDKRIAYLQELFGSTGENIWIEPAFRCDYGRKETISIRRKNKRH